MGLNPLLRFTRDVDQGLEVVETERGAVAPFTGLILERPREGRREEQSFLACILPDRGLDVAAWQRVYRLFGLLSGSHLVSSFDLK